MFTCISDYIGAAIVIAIAVLFYLASRLPDDEDDDEDFYSGMR